MDIIESIIEQRIERNLTQNQLAKATGISQQMINYWEKEKKIPKLEFLIILADYYGITIDKLIGREF